jgi:hypothetical protein
MTLTEMGANALIGEFGEEVIVRSMDNEEPEDSNDPIFMDSSGSEDSSSTHTVRLYTTPANDMLEDYGFDEDTEAIMYSTDEIATVGDEVEYEPASYKWVIDEIATNQIGQQPYIFVYKMVGI